MMKLISFEGEDMIQTPLFSIMFYTVFVTNSRTSSHFLQYNLRIAAVVHGYGSDGGALRQWNLVLLRL